MKINRGSIKRARYSLVSIIAFLSLFITAEAALSAETGRPAGDPVAGKLVYEKHCHFCHGRTGRGDGPVGIAVSPHPANFVTDAKRMKKSDKELFDSLSDGIVKELGGDEMAMPAWRGILTPQERWDVISYIRLLSLEGKEKDRKKLP